MVTYIVISLIIIIDLTSVRFRRFPENVLQNTFTYRGFTYLLVKFRLLLKLTFRKIMFTHSFCKECGADVEDFEVETKEWFKLNKTEGRVLCYNCYCKKSKAHYMLGKKL